MAASATRFSRRPAKAIYFLLYNHTVTVRRQSAKSGTFVAEYIISPNNALFLIS